MPCENIAYPYIDNNLAIRKHVGIGAAGEDRCVTIEVLSNAGAVPIGVSHVDDNGDKDGVTGFCRVYDENGPVTITLTAPAVAHDLYAFRVWVLDGIEQELENTALQVLVGGGECHLAIAKFGGVIDPITGGGCFDGISFPEVITVEASVQLSGPSPGCCPAPSLTDVLIAAWGAYPHVAFAPIVSIDSDGIPSYGIDTLVSNLGCESSTSQCPPGCDVIAIEPVCRPPHVCIPWPPEFSRYHAVGSGEAWFQPSCICGTPDEPLAVRIQGWSGLAYEGKAFQSLFFGGGAEACLNIPGSIWRVGAAITVENSAEFNGTIEDCHAKIAQLMNIPLTGGDTQEFANGMIRTQTVTVIM